MYFKRNGEEISCDGEYVSGESLEVYLSSTGGSTRYVFEVTGGSFSSSGSRCSGTRMDDGNGEIIVAASDGVSSLSVWAGWATSYGTVKITSECTLTAPATSQPIPMPTKAPTPSPTKQPMTPTSQPIIMPTKVPTPSPTKQPIAPSSQPTPAPTKELTASPTMQPISEPSSIPTVLPTLVDTVSIATSVSFLSMSRPPTSSDKTALTSSIAESMDIEVSDIHSLVISSSSSRRRSLLSTTYSWDVTFDVVSSLAASGYSSATAYASAISSTLIGSDFSTTAASNLGVAVTVDTSSVTTTIATRNPSRAPTNRPTYISSTDQSSTSAGGGASTSVDDENEGRDSTDDEGAAAAVGLPWVISGSLLACSAFAGGIYFHKKHRSRNAAKPEEQVKTLGEYPGEEQRGVEEGGRLEGRPNNSVRSARY